MKNWRTSSRRFITTADCTSRSEFRIFSSDETLKAMKEWGEFWVKHWKRVLSDRAFERQLGVSSPLLFFDTFQIRNGRDGAVISEPLCVHSFGFSRSLHFNLVREYTGEFVRFYSGMFLILLHVEKEKKKQTEKTLSKWNAKTTNKQANKKKHVRCQLQEFTQRFIFFRKHLINWKVKLGDEFLILQGTVIMTLLKNK